MTDTDFSLNLVDISKGWVTACSLLCRACYPRISIQAISCIINKAVKLVNKPNWCISLPASSISTDTARRLRKALGTEENINLKLTLRPHCWPKSLQTFWNCCKWHLIYILFMAMIHIWREIKLFCGVSKQMFYTTTKPGWCNLILLFPLRRL